MSNNNYNPFNSLIQEYLCSRLSNLTVEQYRLLSATERNLIYSKGKIISFVKKKGVFAVLSVLTKIGLNWGIYIIDNDFDADEFKELAEGKDFAGNMPTIKKALHEKKSFITNSKFFAHLQNMISNANHGLEVIWNRRFIKFSEKITSKVKDEFDNYSILHPEVEFKKASEGTLLMLEIMGSLPNITPHCRQHGLSMADFILLCKMYQFSEKWFDSGDVEKMYNSKYSKRLKVLSNGGYLNEYQKKYNITTKGVLFVGEIMNKVLDSVYLD